MRKKIHSINLENPKEKALLQTANKSVDRKGNMAYGRFLRSKQQVRFYNNKSVGFNEAGFKV